MLVYVQIPICRISESVYHLIINCRFAKYICCLGWVLEFQIRVCAFLISLRVALKVFAKVITILIWKCEWLTDCVAIMGRVSGYCSQNSTCHTEIRDLDKLGLFNWETCGWHTIFFPLVKPLVRFKSPV